MLRGRRQVHAPAEPPSLLAAGASRFQGAEGSSCRGVGSPSALTPLHNLYILGLDIALESV